MTRNVDPQGSASSPLVVRARGLVRAYGEGEMRSRVLDGVDLDIPAGGIVALVGPSGSGKTTLLNLIGALDHADAGELEVAGVRLDNATADVLQRFRSERVSFVFQFYNLLPVLTARENVELGLEPQGVSRAERRERATEALHRVGLTGRADHFPGQLSGGEQQRVAVARALSRRAPLIIADEPTGSLDAPNRGRILDLVETLAGAGNVTFLLVTHDPAVEARAGTVFRLGDGTLQRER